MTKDDSLTSMLQETLATVKTSSKGRRDLRLEQVLKAFAAKDVAAARAILRRPSL